jgi:hypothetical protein
MKVHFTIGHKKPELTVQQQVADAPGSRGLMVSTGSVQLFVFLKIKNWQNANLFRMTSGNLSGKNLNELAA